MDFVNSIDTDMSLAILSCLDDPSDLVRASAVSLSWREFVIKNNLAKNLCVKLFKQLSSVDHIIEASNEESSEAAGSSSLADTGLLEKEHRAYALLTKGCTSSPIRSCIADAIIASSTDNYPAESILNTLDERDQIGQTPSYWSSTGQHKTSVPETLLYKLNGDLCVITEFSVQPFRAYFQPGCPIYSSHFVRFRLGHVNYNSQDVKSKPGKMLAESDLKYVWTYTSQKFAMAQENRLQNFKLPEPVLCIGGYMLIEFLDRVQTQEMDGLYYICVSHVKVMGRSLTNSFGVVNPDDSGKFGLKVLSYSDPQKLEEEMDVEAGQRPMRNLEELLNFLHRQPHDVEYVWPDSDDDDGESDDEVL